MKPKDKNAGRIGRKLKVLYERIDPILERGSDQYATTCVRGCHHCCYLATTITIPEALLILDTLSRDPYRWRWFEQKLPDLMELAEKLENRETTRESWFDQKIPCVFLRDGECSIYEVRPTVCRTHISTDDPFQCSHEAPRGAPVRRLDTNHLDNLVWSESQRYMNREKLPLGYAPLPMVLIWAYTYWTRGRRGFLNAIEGTALGAGDLANIGAWIHLVRSDPRLTEVVDQLLSQPAYPEDAPTQED